MIVRNEDGAKRARIDPDTFEAAHQLLRGKPGVEQQIALRPVNDRGVALAAAAEDGAAEGVGLSGSLLVHGGCFCCRVQGRRWDRRIESRIL